MQDLDSKNSISSAITQILKTEKYQLKSNNNFLMIKQASELISKKKYC